MTALPAVPPSVAADAVDALPTRLRRKLDDLLPAARAWPVTETPEGYAVIVDADTVVTLCRVVTTAEDLRCGCLLAPRCLHRAAVASLAPTAEDAGPAGDAGPAAAPAPAEAPTAPPVTPVEAAAATALWDAAVAVLLTGIPGAGAVPQAVLLRAAHEARGARLPRGASAAIRVVEHLRAAHRDDPAFRLGELVADLRELLLVAHGLRSGRPLRGTARREYRLVGGRRLYGLCCEPVLTASGYAGAVVHLVDDTGQGWRVADVQPGGVDRAAYAPDALAPVGEARLTLRDLGRAGLLATDLRASADGRISTGRDVRAVATTGVCWSEPPLAGLWRVPVREQVARYHAGLDRPVAERPAGYDLAFLAGRIAGATRAGLLLATDTATVLVVPPHDTPGLPYVDNLRLLAAAVGAEITLVGRFAGGGRVEAIAAGGAWVGEPGHVDLGVDRLTRAMTPAPGVPPETAEPALEPPPLHLLGRRVERAVEGGRPAVPGDPRDAGLLRAAALPTAAGLVDRLESACRVERDVFGRAVAAGADGFARAWLAASVYLTATARSLELARWSPGTVG